MQPSIIQQLLQATLIIISCIGAAAAPGVLGQRRALLDRATVSIYSTPTSGVLDSFWDSKGPLNLEHQVNRLNFKVVRFAGRAAGVPIQPATRAFVIPPITGDSLYSDVEDTNMLRQLLQSGGLVIVHDSSRRPEATQGLIAEILGYQGDWQHCEALTDNSRRTLGEGALTSQAREFLDLAWPPRLEDARLVQVHSWCKHEDADAVSYPLYTVGGDPMKTVAQAFSRVGTPGAVLWLGYSWQAGPQEGWGAMLDRVITAFHKGSFRAPSDASLMENYPLRLDAVIDSVASLAEDTAEIVRRYMSAIVVGSYGYGGYPPAYIPVPSYPPPPTPFPQSPPTLAPLAPPRRPQPPKPTNDTSKRFLWYRYMPAQGVQGGSNRPVVWYDDADFGSQLNLHYNNSNLWLVEREKQICDLESPCRMCKRAWNPYNGSDAPGFPSNTLVLYFREPMLLKRVVILELVARGVEEVFLLDWPAVPIPELGLNVTRLYDSVNQTTDVYTSLRRRAVTDCASRIDAYVKPPRSDELQIVPPAGSTYNQTHLPAFFGERAVGGVGIRMRAPPAGTRRPVPQIADVRFVGRVLYPRQPSEYGPYLRPRQLWNEDW